MRVVWWLSVHVAALHAAILPPPWADPNVNPCSTQPGGWLKLYWPQDGQCYRIFQRGAPCPDTMELSPGASGAECRCPPGQVQTHEDSPCYQIHTRGPCLKGQYLAPLQDDARARRGVCREVASCPQVGELFWPAGGGVCYPEYSRGPCPHGQLLVHHNRTGLAECGCDSTGPLSRFYWSPTKSCHQFYTRGPCLEKGALFLPGPQCGCHHGLPNYYSETEQCYEIGSSGPCKTGQLFSGHSSGCTCKPDHVPWLDGHCYRAFTRGPCPADQLLSADGTCRPLPCPRGKLYFPEEDMCHRVGVRGPCARGQLVLFEQSVRPSVEGISYRGMCGCPDLGTCKEESATGSERSNQSPATVGPTKVPRNAHIDYSSATLCETMADKEICYQLYTQGPCLQGQWLVPNRQSRAKRRAHTSRIPSSIGVYIGHRFNPAVAEPLRQTSQSAPQLFQDSGQLSQERRKGRCECRPGYSPLPEGQGCQVPLVALAKFLNGQDFFS